jgi:hypothetical protein
MPTATAPEAPALDAPENGACAFYRRVMSQLDEAGVPYLVGGAYALFHFTSIARNTKDFDVFMRREDIERAMAVLEGEGCHTELTYPHWLGKARCGEDFVDIIFSSGNAVATVDDEWFAHAPYGDVLGRRAKLSPAEEMIWSKAFIMERERFDGADVHHLLLRCGAHLDWARLLRRFGPHWRVLLSHLITFGFVYPAERTTIPTWVMDHLLSGVQRELRAPPGTNARVCFGPLLSRAQYLVATEQWGYDDARLGPKGFMSDDEVAQWTAAAIEAQAKAESQR